MGHQSGLAARFATRHDDAGAHIRMVGKRVLDLLELDPAAANLDLMVDAPEAFQRPVGSPARQISGPVQARAAPFENGSGRKRCRFCSGSLR